jgi:LacI family transcriptional regulator
MFPYVASLSDVSKHAGVSIATCSRVLNGSTHPVSARTRDRVLAAAEELGYAPSALARALVTRETRIIGVVVGDVVDPYFAEIARGAEDVAAAHGYLTMICSADRGTAAEIEHVSILRDYRAAGIVFAGSGASDDPQTEELRAAVAGAREQGSSVVALAPRDVDAPHIIFDNRAAAYDITDYVISLGHERVAFVEGPPSLYSSQQRRDGFREAMRDRGLDADLIVEGGFSYEAGSTAALRLLGLPERPEAFVAVNDEAAIGVLMTLRQAGIDVPGEVSVAGIDDTRPARFVELTTVAVPLYELGAAAAREVLDERRNGRPMTDMVLPHRLTPRGTTARRRR